MAKELPKIWTGGRLLWLTPVWALYPQPLLGQMLLLITRLGVQSLSLRILVPHHGPQIQQQYLTPPQDAPPSPPAPSLKLGALLLTVEVKSLFPHRLLLLILLSQQDTPSHSASHAPMGMILKHWTVGQWPKITNATILFQQHRQQLPH